MAKVKVSAIKLFDNRRPLCHSICGRQPRLCSCYVGVRKSEIRNIIHSEMRVVNKSATGVLKGIVEQMCENENNNLEQPQAVEKADDISTVIPERSVDDDDDDGSNLAQRISVDRSLSSSIDDTDNSISYNCDDGSPISSVAGHSNSSWNKLSRDSPPKPQKEVTEVKYARNEFPTVFTKYENVQRHMNLSRDREDVVIPINYTRKVVAASFQTDKCQTVVTAENSTEYDLDSDRVNASLVEFKRAPVDPRAFRLGPRRCPSRITNKSVNIGSLALLVYISDIRGVEDSLILNKDRRFCRIVERYKCSVSIIQMNDMSRGFPHTLLKINGASKMNLQCMTRDADKIHPHWNLRSQLRSLHT